MTRTLALLILTLLPATALADVDTRFAKLRDGAEPIGSLGTFLDKFVGECTDTFEGEGCKKKAEQFRAEARKKKHYMIVGEEQATMLQPGEIDLQTGEFTLHLTPFFAGGKYAVTHGAPKKTDKAGNPVMPLVTLEGKLPDDAQISRFQRLFQNRELRVQVVFTPQDVWTLPKKGGGRNYGVRAKVDGLLITHGRSGREVAIWLNK